MNNKNHGFNLMWTLIIVVITSIVSALTTGVVVYNNNKLSNKISYADLSKDESLNQFLEVYANILSEYYEDIDKDKLLEKAIAAMMSYLGDDYTTYLDDDATNELVESLSGEYVGIGVSINNSDKSISKVYEDTPAFKANLQAGDVIVGFNDVDVREVSASEIVKMIKNNNGPFTLKLMRGADEISVTLAAEKIISPNIDYYLLPESTTGYLQITAFSKTLSEQVSKALNKMEESGMTNLIIDLRNNTGGYLDAAEAVANKFLAKDKLIYSLNYKNEVTKYVDKTEEARTYDIIILLNGNSASASEILAAALQDSYGAKIVGETSFGKGKVQQTMELEDGSMVKYTSARWLTPKGICIDGAGIAPDYPISNEEVKDEEGNVTEIIDRQLEKAQSILNANIN